MAVKITAGGGAKTSTSHPERMRRMGLAAPCSDCEWPEWKCRPEPEPANVPANRSSTAPAPQPDAEQRLTVAPTTLPNLSLFEQAYGNFGLWNGPYSTREGANREVDFWKSAGLSGIFWLVGRVRSETDTQILASAANVLSELGQDAVDPILRGLETGPSLEQSYCLLRALASMPIQQTPRKVDRLARIIKFLFVWGDTDTREAACVATNVLPTEQAVRVLREILGISADQMVRQAIEDELAAREGT